MLIKELFGDLHADDDPDIEISVLIPEELLIANSITLESIWQSSGRSGWVFRVDPPDPDIPLDRHVHIAKEKHKSSKKMQASWNEDGTRHDKKSFNDKVGNTKVVRDIARQALGIGDDITLESLNYVRINIVDDVTFSEDGNEAYIRISIQA